jgi:hypothetical protein
MQMIAMLKARLSSPSKRSGGGGSSSSLLDDDDSDGRGTLKKQGSASSITDAIGDISKKASGAVTNLFSSKLTRGVGVPSSERAEYEDFSVCSIVELFEEIQLRCGLQLINVDIHKTLHLGLLVIDRAFSAAIPDKVGTFISSHDI